MIEIFIFGQRYEVPEGFTILKAYEYAGFSLKPRRRLPGRLSRRLGTVYRFTGDYKPTLRVGLPNCRRNRHDAAGRSPSSRPSASVTTWKSRIPPAKPSCISIR